MNAMQHLPVETIKALIDEALHMLRFSYAPYSHFKVGAALLSEDGRIFGGCNIENAAFTPGNCAERTAFFRALSEGVSSFSAIAIVGGHEGRISALTWPCGVCRQVMREFCDPDRFIVISATDRDRFEAHTLGELLPFGFGPKNL